MPVFKFHLYSRKLVEFDELGVHLSDLYSAYLEICRIVPDRAIDLLARGENPTAYTFIIADGGGTRLLDVPFIEVLRPLGWRTDRGRSDPDVGVRSDQARRRLALSSFRRMFGSANVGSLLLTPELQVLDISEFGAQHANVDRDEVNGRFIFDIFSDLEGEAKRHFTRYVMLARAGVVSEMVDLPYYVLDRHGRTTMGWWNARMWPIFDDDGHLLGLVDWAVPSTEPNAGGTTLVRAVPGPNP